MLVFLLLAACAKSEDPETLAQSTGGPDHVYAIYTDGEYGYRQELSEDEIKAGAGGNTLVMMKYLGARDGKYQFVTTDPDDGSHLVMECDDPCKFITMSVVYKGTFVRREIMEWSPNTVAGSAFVDAMNGFLEAFVGKDKDMKPYHLWFDGKKITKIDA